MSSILKFYSGIFSTQDVSLYEQWRQVCWPSIVQVLELFPSLRVPPSLLLTQLPVLLMRYYSISSSARCVPAEIHLTLAVVHYRTNDTQGTLHEGVCSTWLSKLETGATVPCFIRRVPDFHMPEDGTRPMILVGPGTGIAPFRSFWQQRKIDLDMHQEPRRGTAKGCGDIYLYFGCRRSDMDHIYKTELEQMKQAGVLKDVSVALSREPNVAKTYVQNTLKKNAGQVYRTLVKEGGHFYVCGDIHMASDVTSVLEKIFVSEGKMTAQNAKNCILKLRDADRFHEDTFGLKVRTSHVSGKSRTPPKTNGPINGIHITKLYVQPRK